MARRTRQRARRPDGQTDGRTVKIADGGGGGDGDAAAAAAAAAGDSNG